MGHTKPLIVVDAADPTSVLAALSSALFDGGPAILPRLGGANDVRTAPTDVPTEAALVIETSGTTGRPKRVWLSAEALIAAASVQLEALSGPGVWWLTLPTSYIAGIQVLTRSLLAGTSPVMSPPGPFGPDQLTQVMPQLLEASKQGPVYSAMVPAQLRRLLDHAAGDPTTAEALHLLDAILVGGQAVPPALVSDAEELGVKVIRTYGSAETAGGCVWNGVPLPDVVVAEKEGRLAVSCPYLAGGYLDDPQLTAKRFVIDADRRWYLTDDQAVIEPEGTVRIIGRVDDVIVSGGKKVSLAEVEALVVEATGVSDCVVVASTHPEWGHTPVIVSPEAIDFEGVRYFVGTRLGAHARPDRLVIVDKLPLLASGKPDRVALTAKVSQ